MNKIKLTSIILIAIILIVSANSFSQTNKTQKNMNTTNPTTGYLDKNDSLFIKIQERALTDLKDWMRKNFKDSPETILMKEKIETLSKEKKSKIDEIVKKTFRDYTTQTNIDEGVFMLILGSFKEMDEGKMVEKWDTRVQSIGGNKYVAEFWADENDVSDDVSIVLGLHKMSDDYANKSANKGKPEGYSKVMVLLYIKETTGSFNLYNPFQPIIDFIDN